MRYIKRYIMRCVAILAAAALVAMASAPAAAASPPLTFNDVSTVPWAEPAIAFLAAQGVVKGVSASAFAPDQPVTAEQVVTFLARLFPSAAAQPTVTLPGVASWAQAAVHWASQHGIIPDLRAFDPTAPAPRAEVVTWVVQALGLPTASAPAPSFGDAAAIPPADAAAVGAAQADGLVVGDANGNFDPAASVTRAQLALILLRAEEALALDAGTPAQAPYAWQSGSASLLAGTATTGSATLPAGAITAGRLSGGTSSGTGGGTTTGASGSADFVEAAGVGAGTLATASGRVPFLWQQPTATTPGGLWLYPAAATAPIAYTYTAPGATGAVQVTAASGLAANLGAGETLTVQPPVGAGGTETATATVTLGAAAGGTTLSLAYSGPALPTAVLIATETAAAAADVTAP